MYKTLWELKLIWNRLFQCHYKCLSIMPHKNVLPWKKGRDHHARKLYPPPPPQEVVWTLPSLLREPPTIGPVWTLQVQRWGSQSWPTWLQSHIPGLLLQLHSQSVWFAIVLVVSPPAASLTTTSTATQCLTVHVRTCGEWGLQEPLHLFSITKKGRCSWFLDTSTTVGLDWHGASSSCVFLAATEKPRNQDKIFQILS